jgi:hypothetical protein
MGTYWISPHGLRLAATGLRPVECALAALGRTVLPYSCRKINSPPASHKLTTKIVNTISHLVMWWCLAKVSPRAGAAPGGKSNF